jgi:hypothetical protein
MEKREKGYIDIFEAVVTNKRDGLKTPGYISGNRKGDNHNKHRRVRIINLEQTPDSSELPVASHTF